MPPLNHAMTSEQGNKPQMFPTDKELPVSESVADGGSQTMGKQVQSQTTGKKVAIMNSLRKRVGRGRGGLKKRALAKKRDHLMEQHFKIDQENRVLLPGVIKYDDDLTRDMHDFFNLICLVSSKCIATFLCTFAFLSYHTLNLFSLASISIGSILYSM
jgi:hypothetical protein